jgi:hypothetical protein
MPAASIGGTLWPSQEKAMVERCEHISLFVGTGRLDRIANLIVLSVQELRTTQR